MASVLVMVVILVASLGRLLLAYRGTAMHEGLLAMLYKLVGAGVGSGLAVWFRKSPRWALQLATGVATGYLAGQWFLDWREWPMTTDYILLSGAIMGIVGYSLVEGILSIDFKRLARWWADRKTGNVEPEKP